MTSRPLPDWITQVRRRPLAIAHRGASAYAPDNTKKAFLLAHQLGAEMWEVDIQVSRDGVPIVCHDANLLAVTGQEIACDALDAAEITSLATLSAEPIPLLSDIATLARDTGTALYLDVKDLRAAEATLACLNDLEIEKAIFGTTDPDFCRTLKDQGCAYPVSLLVGLGKNPWALADRAGCDIIHPCWEKAGDRPDQLLDEAFFKEAQTRNMPVVCWHEERPEVARALCAMPLLGICSDTPQLLKPYHALYPEAPEVVCHRGANTLAPENTLAAAHAAFAFGYQTVEIDVRQSLDGKLVVIHDETLDRTTNGNGPVDEHSLKTLRALDAGSWFSSHYAREQIPTLQDILYCACHWQGQLYVELKKVDPLRVLKEVEQAGLMKSCFFWSFNRDRLHALKAANPQARIMSRREDYDTLQDCLSDFAPEIVEYNTTNIDPREFEAIRANHAKVMIAYMGTDPQELVKIARSQPDIVNINATLDWPKALAGL